MKRKIELLGFLALLATSAPAIAQGNFGGQGPTTPPGAMGSLETEPVSKEKPSPGMSSGSNSGGDYTSDEKRMQKKYKENVNHAKGLIEKGDSMMKTAKGNTSHKDYKKGKIIKEIGERRLAELQANNPFPEPEKPVKAGKGKDDTKKEL